MWPFRLARVLPGGIDVVTALRGEHDLVAVVGEETGEHGLARTFLAVDRRGVEERDPRLERGVDQPILVDDLTPPVAGKSPRAEANLGDDEIGVADVPVLHWLPLWRSTLRST